MTHVALGMFFGGYAFLLTSWLGCGLLKSWKGVVLGVTGMIFGFSVSVAGGLLWVNLKWGL